MKYLKVIHSCRYVIYTHLNMIDKRIITGIALLIGLAIAVYFVYFHKGSAEDLLAKNIKTRSIANKLQGTSIRVNFCVFYAPGFHPLVIFKNNIRKS